MNVEFDYSQNLLTFSIAGDGIVEAWHWLPARIDIGERGRLLSLEIDLPHGPLVLPIEDLADPLARTAEIEVEAGFTRDGRPVMVRLPRRGAGYEISYPSGNQCWIGANGEVSCTVA